MSRVLKLSIYTLVAILALLFILYWLMILLMGSINFTANDQLYSMCKSRGMVGSIMGHEYCKYMGITFYESGTPRVIR